MREIGKEKAIYIEIHNEAIRKCEVELGNKKRNLSEDKK